MIKNNKQIKVGDHVRVTDIDVLRDTHVSMISGHLIFQRMY